MKVIERIEAHYEVEDVEFGKVYRWCPESAMVNCTCGERLNLTRLESTCGWCSADHAAEVQEELGAQQRGDEAVHPWRYAEDREGVGVPF
jgi:hypothetical protein